MEALGAEVQRLRAENDSLRAENKSLRGLVGSSPHLARLQPPTIKQEATMHLAAMMSPPAPAPAAAAAPAAPARVKRELPIGALPRAPAPRQADPGPVQADAASTAAESSAFGPAAMPLSVSVRPPMARESE